MTDPVVALISSYKEGVLIQGTIRSVIGVADAIVVCEGKTQAEDVEGPQTNIGLYRNVEWEIGNWESETAKRNHMLDTARTLIKSPFWILTIDADEILIWGEYLKDWLSVVRPGYPESQENIIPIKRTEMAWTKERGFATDIAPSRLVHSSMLGKYLVGCWKIQAIDGKEGFLNHISPADMQPVYGEPHIHHRPYLRRNERKGLRLSQGEEATWIRENIGSLCKHPNAARRLDRKDRSDTVTICPDCHGRIKWENQRWVEIAPTND